MPTAPRSPSAPAAGDLGPERSPVRRRSPPPGSSPSRRASRGTPATRRSRPGGGRRRRSSERASSRRSCRPRALGRSASFSSGAHIIGVTQAMLGFTAWPDRARTPRRGPARSRRSRCWASSGSMKAKLSAPIPWRAASRIVSRREQATQSGGWGFWTGLGTTLRGGACTKRPSTPVNGVFGHGPDGDLETLQPLVPLLGRVDAEAAQLGLGRRLARTELDPAARHEVEHGHPLRGADRVVVAGCGLDDPVARGACWSCAGWRRRGTPRGRSSASTPRGSGARPPRRSRCRSGRRTRPGRGRRRSVAVRPPRTMGGGADARRTGRTARGAPIRLVVAWSRRSSQVWRGSTAAARRSSSGCHRSGSTMGSTTNLVAPASTISSSRARRPS